MARLAVHPSPFRLLLRGLVGLVLLVVAAEILWLHIVAAAPEVSADGTLTSRGQNSRRLDVTWGSVFALAGTALVVSSVGRLAARHELVVVRPEGMEMRLGGPSGGMTFVPWESVRSVRSTVFDDVTGTTPVLEVQFDGDLSLPARPAGAVWDGARLLLDAEDWDMRAVDVAVVARLALDRAQHPPDGARPDEEMPYS